MPERWRMAGRALLSPQFEEKMSVIAASSISVVRQKWGFFARARKGQGTRLKG